MGATSQSETVFLYVYHLRLQAKQEREEEERKRRIQTYVFVLRTIAYPFNAKQSGDMQRRHPKVTKEMHEKMKARVEVSE